MSAATIIASLVEFAEIWLGSEQGESFVSRVIYRSYNADGQTRLRHLPPLRPSLYPTGRAAEAVWAVLEEVAAENYDE